MSSPVRESGPTQTDYTKGASWKPRPGAARFAALLVRGGPILFAAFAALLAARQLPRPHGWLWAVWLLAIAFVSQASLRLAEYSARRFLPLPAMLRISLVFPDAAPSRFASALRSGNTERLRRELSDGEQTIPLDLSAAAAAALRLVGVLNRHDRGTRGHSERVRAYSELLAEELGCDRSFREKLRWGSLLHDMGKLTVPSEILNKPGRPTEAEWKVLSNHPAEGERILAPLRDWLGDAFHAAGQHHERWDGGGYPRGLAGEEIALSARIVAVADAFAVMTTSRAYKKPLPLGMAREELTRGAGTQFDPDVVRAMLNLSVATTPRAAGPLATLASAPVVGSLLAGAQAIPATVGTGAAAIALATGFLAPSSPLQFASPFTATPPIEVIAQTNGPKPLNQACTSAASASCVLALADDDANNEVDASPRASTIAPTGRGETGRQKTTSRPTVTTQPNVIPAQTIPAAVVAAATPTTSVALPTVISVRARDDGSTAPGDDPTTARSDSPISTHSVTSSTIEDETSTIPASAVTRRTNTTASATKPPSTQPGTSSTTRPTANQTTTTVSETKPPKTPPLATTTTAAEPSDTTPTTISDTKPPRLPPLSTSTTSPPEETTPTTTISDTKPPRMPPLATTTIDPQTTKATTSTSPSTSTTDPPTTRATTTTTTTTTIDPQTTKPTAPPDTKGLPPTTTNPGKQQ